MLCSLQPCQGSNNKPQLLGLIPSSYKSEYTSATVLFATDIHTRWNDDLVESVKQWNEGSKVLMSLDGGGVRVLIVTQILLFLDGELGNTLADRVDWLAGTSCGGIIALMMSSGHIFVITTVQLQVDLWNPLDVKVPKHDASGIEQVAKDAFGLDNMSNLKSHLPKYFINELKIYEMVDEEYFKVMVTVADTRRSPPSLVLFRSFTPNIPEDVREKNEYLDPEKILIWKAARCTSAAPYFFDSFNGLSDGGLVANNPTQVLMSDFLKTAKLEKEFAQVN
uniref:PNPLA domain-containing protein n=1 Tax=Heterorhabditis bacteriophora TaxID=37862 RepID=A0A1I7X4F9_HETBA